MIKTVYWVKMLVQVGRTLVKVGAEWDCLYRREVDKKLGLDEAYDVCGKFTKGGLEWE